MIYQVNILGIFTVHPEVVSITESRIVKLATTHSPDFLGLHEEHEEGFHVKGSIWNISSYGDNMIIANIDSGKNI